MCIGLKRLSLYPREHTLSNKRSVYKIDKVERTGPRKGKTRAKWCCCSRFFQESKCLFSKDNIIACHFGLPFLLPLVFEQTENSQTGVFCQKEIGKKPLRSTSGEAVFVFRHTEERDGITNSHVACRFTYKIVPSFTVQVWREKVCCVTVLFRFCFFFMFYYTI